MSSRAPSIKGSALATVVEDLQRLRDTGRLAADTLEARLEPEDLALLEVKIQPALWYPIQSYRRLTEVLLELEGRGDTRYLVERGARAAERIWATGVYVQLQHGEEKARAARDRGEVISERDARLITSLSGAIFSFTRWTYRLDDESRAVIDVEEAEALPEVSIHAIRGFLEYTVSRLRGIETTIRVERPAPDTVRFHFDR